MNNLTRLKHVIVIYTFILVVWGFYRYLFRLPDQIEEGVLKPLLWLGPVFWFVHKEKANLTSLGWTGKKFFKSLYLGISFGLAFAVLGLISNFAKYQGFSFAQLSFVATPSLFYSALILSLLTAISEETAFRGYIFNRLWQIFKSESLANFISSIGWAIVHLPITIFIFHYNLYQMIIFLVLTFIFGVGSAFVFARTKSIVPSILLNVFWGWPIILFR